MAYLFIVYSSENDDINTVFDILKPRVMIIVLLYDPNIPLVNMTTELGE